MPKWAKTLPEYLESHLHAFSPSQALKHDPIRFVRPWPAGDDREVVSLFAALLSYGRVQSIGQAIESAVRRMGPHPASSARQDTVIVARQRFEGFVHRVTRGDDLARVWLGLGAILRTHKTLGDALRSWDTAGSDDFRPLLSTLRSEIVNETSEFPAERSFAHFLPDPNKGSACKWYMMWLRWMVRGPDEVDLGDWSFLGAARLRFPLDTHIHRIGRNLGLIERRAADWKTAEELTSALRTFDAEDPVRYEADFW